MSQGPNDEKDEKEKLTIFSDVKIYDTIGNEKTI